jgi:hypothetical protein
MTTSVFYRLNRVVGTGNRFAGKQLCSPLEDVSQNRALPDISLTPLASQLSFLKCNDYSNHLKSKYYYRRSNSSSVNIVTRLWA